MAGADVTLPRMSTPRPDHAALCDELRARGLRATASRVAVLDGLRRRGAPASHGEMAEALSEGPWNRTTVYRNLLDLARVGLARRFDVGDSVWRYEAVGSRDGHPHFVCDRCGDVACLDGVELALGEPRRAPRALRERDVEVAVLGRCDRCAG